MNNLRLKEVLVIFFLTVTVSVSLAQDFQLEEYKKAFELLEKDSTIAREYCQSGIANLSVYTQFQYISISTFNDFLKNISLSSKDFEGLNKLDRKQFKNKDKEGYKRMLDNFYAYMNPSETPCAVVCFDRMKADFIVARIAKHKAGPSWQSVVGEKNYHIAIIDTRANPFKYWIGEVTR